MSYGWQALRRLSTVACRAKVDLTLQPPLWPAPTQCGCYHRPVKNHLLLVALVLVAVSCSGGSKNPTTPTTPTTTTPTTTTPTPPSAAPCRFASTGAGVGLGFPRNAAKVRTTGDVRYTVLFVDFPGAPATRTPESMLSLVSPASEAYFRSLSYGKMTLLYQPELRWLRMSQPASAYVFSTFAGHRDYIQEAVTLAGSSVDYSRTDALLVLADPATVGLSTPGPALGANIGAGVTAGGRVFSNGVTSGRDLNSWGALWANHEIGHNLGLPDLYASSNPAHRYVGMYSLMGLISGPAREFFAWERWNLDWLDDSQVWCATTAGTTEVPLTPVSQSGGLKMIVVPVSASSAVVVESRRVEGYDSGFAAGALAYVVDVSLRTLQGPIRVLPLDEADQNKSSAILTAGRSLSYAGITVSVVSSTGSTDTVRVVR